MRLDAVDAVDAGDAGGLLREAGQKGAVASA
jgi:hypothetical protein